MDSNWDEKGCCPKHCSFKLLQATSRKDLGRWCLPKSPSSFFQSCTAGCCKEMPLRADKAALVSSFYTIICLSLAIFSRVYLSVRPSVHPSIHPPNPISQVAIFLFLYTMVLTHWKPQSKLTFWHRQTYFTQQNSPQETQ